MQSKVDESDENGVRRVLQEDLLGVSSQMYQSARHVNIGTM